MNNKVLPFISTAPLMIGLIIILVALTTESNDSQSTMTDAPAVLSMQDTVKVVQNNKSNENNSLTTLNQLRQIELETNSHNNSILLGFRLKMTQTEYQARKQALIQSGKLKPWDKIHYSACLFTIQENVQDEIFRENILIPNSANIELRWEPEFVDNKLVSWKLPVWFDFTHYSNPLLNLVNYFTALYGEPLRIGTHYLWIKGNLEIAIFRETVPKPPYGTEDVPVIMYSDNACYLTQ